MVHMRSNFVTKVIFQSAPLALLLWVAGCSYPTRTVDPGTKWEVAATTTLSELTIGEGASVVASEGRSLTMTVGGVETPVKAGTYKGKVVLTPAQEIAIPFNAMDHKETYKHRAAIFVDKNVYIPEKSVPSAVSKGKVTNTSAKNVKITSVGDRFAGIMVSDHSTYTIDNADIRLTGNGKNDFAGVAPAIRVGTGSKVTVNNTKIVNTGMVRTAIWVGNGSEVTVNNSEIEANTGTVPKDYGWSWTRGGAKSTDVMMDVPWMLGLTGNNRATLIAGGGTATYNNTHIKAQGWGAMSTDGGGDDVSGQGAATFSNEMKIYLNKCHVETVDSGYGTYALGGTTVYSNGTTWDVADYAMIATGGGSAIFSDGTTVNSRRVGIMAWGQQGGSLTVEKGTVFNTEKAVFQLKNATPKITIDNATLNSKKGIILEMFPNDDPNQMGPPGPGGAGGGGHHEGAGAPGGAGAPAAGGAGGGPGAAATKTKESDDEFTTVKNANLTGDFVNALTAKNALNLSLVNSTINGAITTATSVHALGKNGEKLVMQDSTALYYLIGEVNHTYAATNEKHGVNVSLDPASKWVVAKTSYLTGLTIAPGATVAAPNGSKLTMTVNGVTKPIAPGDYKGKIVLKVAAGA
jgi:hypothetical protein